MADEIMDDTPPEDWNGTSPEQRSMLLFPLSPLECHVLQLVREGRTVVWHGASNEPHLPPVIIGDGCHVCEKCKGLSDKLAHVLLDYRREMCVCNPWQTDGGA